MKKLSRRLSLQYGAGAIIGFLLPSRVIALSENHAKRLIENVASDINTIINSGKSGAALTGDVEKLFKRYADLDIIAKTTLGRDSRRASSAQLRAFSRAFSGYMARKYSKVFREFEGGRIEIEGIRRVKSWHEVKTGVYLRGRSKIQVLFLVSDKSGKDLFFDMIIEGISLRLTERTEITAMLERRKGDINALTEDLKKAG